MIVDGFVFFNELDLLEIRLEELYPVVDRFVIVESDQSFRGHPKPANFADNILRYDKYLDKIIYLTAFMAGAATTGDRETDPWVREYYQRRTIDEGFANLGPDDIVLISDVDEIPRRSAVASLDMTDRQITFGQRRFIYGINMDDGRCASTKAIRYRDYTNAQDERMMPPTTIIEDGGWEFSSCGTPEQISHKLKNFAHFELDQDIYTNPDRIRERILAGRDILDRHDNVKRVEIDDTWPEAIKNNRDKYRHLEW